MLACLQNLFHLIQLPLRQRRIILQLQQLGESQNSVQRRPKLMAHPGHELGLGPVRFLRLFLSGN
ncbi:hypothetical protein D3C71_2081370 [compost metagenome]